jgi:hypothetical protein
MRKIYERKIQKDKRMIPKVKRKIGKGKEKDKKKIGKGKEKRKTG